MRYSNVVPQENSEVSAVSDEEITEKDFLQENEIKRSCQKQLFSEPSADQITQASHEQSHYGNPKDHRFSQHIKVGSMQSVPDFGEFAAIQHHFPMTD